MNLRGPSLPRECPWPVKAQVINEIAIPHPPIEESPNFLARIEPRCLVNAARCYNPSIARHNGKIIMAYRAESYTAVSRVAYARLDSEMRVREAGSVPLPEDDPDCHWEDPRLCVCDGHLYLMAAYIRLVVPPVCRQRLFEIDAVTMEPIQEVKMTFGKLGGIEKNWTPFEDAFGQLAFVYQQRPRMVIEVGSMRGHESEAPAIAPAGNTLSGRTPPVRMGDSYLEFVGGWHRIPTRNGRYWFGAQLFGAKPPYKVTNFTKEPLLWGSEGSPTIHSPRPNAGHPCCVFPAGAIVDGDDVTVSVGVNDSYCCLMRYSVAELLERMVPA